MILIKLELIYHISLKNYKILRIRKVNDSKLGLYITKDISDGENSK